MGGDNYTMNLTFHKTQCCGVNEIGQLRYFAANPAGAMLDFCEQSLPKPPKYGTYTAYEGTLYTFYYFTAGVYDIQDRSSCYGYQFAKFIEDNKLGTVISHPPKINKAWHPDHWAQVWLWSPDTPAIKAWYEKNKPKPVGTT